MVVTESFLSAKLKRIQNLTLNGFVMAQMSEKVQESNKLSNKKKMYIMSNWR